MESGQYENIGFREVIGEDGTTPDAITTETTKEGALPPRLNPFILVLWALSGVFILGGLLALLNGSLEVSMTDHVSMAYILFTFAPPNVFIGVATVLGLMFWHAWHWQRAKG